jgi:hypothetical protein
MAAASSLPLDLRSPIHLHSLQHAYQNHTGRVQRRQAVLQTVEVAAAFQGQQEALGVPLGDDLFPEVDGQLVQAFDAGLGVRQLDRLPNSAPYRRAGAALSGSGVAPRPFARRWATKNACVRL